MEFVKKDSGFTLIELLVTLVILGIAVALVSVKLAPDDHRELATEAQRLSLLLQQARDEALTSGQSIAFGAKSPRYEFLQRNRKNLAEAPEWQVHRDNTFRLRELPHGFTLAIIEPAASERIVFTPSGVQLPFRLRLQYKSERIDIAGQASGTIQVEEQSGS
jgi:general secretion pathway protein H